MGEGGVKPKLERGAQGKPQQQQKWAPRKQSTVKTFKAPTPGLESKIFKQGDAADAAAYNDVKKDLAKYVGVHFSTGNHMASRAIEDLVEPSIVKPPNPPAESTPPTVDEIVARKEWEHELDAYYKKKRAWEDAKPRAFLLVMSHVETELEAKLETSSDWSRIKADSNVVALLILIRGLVHKHDEVKQGTMALVDLDVELVLNYQKPNEDLPTFHKLFKARCDVIDTFGGRAGYHPVLYRQHRRAIADTKTPTPPATEVPLSALTDEENNAALLSSCEEYKAALFIRISNEAKYGHIKKDLENQNLQPGTDPYPKTLAAAVAYLQNYQKTTGNQKVPYQPGNLEGVSFAQTGKQVGPCHGCQKMGHVVKDCPDLNNEEKMAVAQAKGLFAASKQGQAHINVADKADKELQECLEGVANINVNMDDASIETADGDGTFEGVAFITPGAGAGTVAKVRVNCGRNKLFLDSCATQHTMFAVEYLLRRHVTKVLLRQNCNAGSKITNKCGYYMDLRFYESEGGIANLLSVPALEKAGWKIRMETGKPVQALSPEGLLITFKRDTGMTGGMPYIDMDRPQDHFSRIVPKESVALIETVRKNMQGFTLEQCTKAKAARDALAMMAHPPDEKVKHLVRSNNVTNVPFTSTDFTNGKVLFGPDRAAIRGKTTRQRPSRVRPELIMIPQQLYENLRDVVLTADVMFVNGLPFFVTESRGIKLRTIEFLPSRTKKKLHQSLQTVARFYRRGGFIIRMCLMDMEFKPLEEISTDVPINTTAAREHVNDIERSIRTVKDRSRSVLSELPYKHCLPDVFIIYLLRFVILWLNAFPEPNGASDEFSPREIVTGLRLDYKKHCRARFGSYVEASQDPDITNTMADRTAPCIMLGPTGNVQGSVNCFNLETKLVVTRRTIKPLPMPDRVIRRVVSLGKRCKQQRVSQRLQFLNRLKEKFSWGDGTEDGDADQNLVEPEQHDTDVLPAEIPGVELEEDFAELQAAVQPDNEPTYEARAEAALQNANLRDTATDPEIAGVDDNGLALPADPPIVSDDDASQENDEDEDLSFNGGGNDDDDQGDGQGQLIDLANDDESGHVQEEEVEEQDLPNGSAAGLADEEESVASESSSTGAVRRRSKRKRKKKQPTVIDFGNRAYQVKDGVMHINPNVLEQVKQDAKITSMDLPAKPTEEEPESKAVKERTLGFRSPAIAGISSQALDRVSLGGLGLPPPNLKDGEAIVEDHVMMHVLGVVLAEQYSINKGIRLFGERAKESISKELRQLHDYVTYVPIHAHELTPEQKKQALASLIFLTEKRCGRIKTRACVNGSTQRDYIPKENTASPTVMTDSVMVTSAIDAHEGRVVVTCDIPGAFLHADLDEEVIMLLRGQLADLMVQVDPELYGPYLRKSKKGESILYVKMLKAMYGLLRSALLFYLKLVKDLTDYGFELNPYDPCVANKMVDGKQVTVVWHVDDLKISHMSRQVIDGLLDYLRSKYGDGLVVHEGHVHDYLGVDHDYSEKGVVKMSMMKHLDKIFQDFPEDIGASSLTPASENLFKIRDSEENDAQGKWLDKEKAKDFHHSVAQLLFVSSRVRRDIQTPVAFLTTRVKKPDQDDWGKLKRVLKYLKGTRFMKLKLSAETLSTIQWWVDASYCVHEDCRGQTGAMMSLGRGAPMSFSWKQKLNVRSSCEGELVGIDDALPHILWARYFIEAQGYTVEQNVMYQDNKSTILLANNGRWSSSKRTKHIRSRYFFIKDKVQSGDVSIEYRPTDKMWSDVLTKPKQGAAFRQDRSMLMNCDVEYDDEKEMRDTPKVLLPKQEGPVDPNTITSIIAPSSSPGNDRRSVLDNDIKKQHVVWNTSQNRVDVNNSKLRRRHLELVIARVMRAQGAAAA